MRACLNAFMLLCASIAGGRVAACSEPPTTVETKQNLGNTSKLIPNVFVRTAVKDLRPDDIKAIVFSGYEFCGDTDGDDGYPDVEVTDRHLIALFLMSFKHAVGRRFGALNGTQELTIYLTSKSSTNPEGVLRWSLSATDPDDLGPEFNSVLHEFGAYSATKAKQLIGQVAEQVRTVEVSVPGRPTIDKTVKDPIQVADLVEAWS